MPIAPVPTIPASVELLPTPTFPIDVSASESAPVRSISVVFGSTVPAEPVAATPERISVMSTSKPPAETV